MVNILKEPPLNFAISLYAFLPHICNYSTNSFRATGAERVAMGAYIRQYLLILMNRFNDTTAV